MSQMPRRVAALILRKTRDTVAEVTRHTGLPITIGPNGAVHVMIEANILSNDSAVGLAQRSFQGSTIIGGTIKFASVQDGALFTQSAARPLTTTIRD
jgi:hypothetical protein